MNIRTTKEFSFVWVRVIEVGDERRARERATSKREHRLRAATARWSAGRGTRQPFPFRLVLHATTQKTAFKLNMSSPEARGGSLNPRRVKRILFTRSERREAAARRPALITSTNRPGPARALPPYLTTW